MWGEAGRRGRNWRVEEGELDIGRRERFERQRRLKEERFGALEDRRTHYLHQKQESAMLAAAAARSAAAKAATAGARK